VTPSLYLPYYSSEVDKVRNSWIVTYWLGAVVLQFKVRQYSYQFPAEYTCQIRLRESIEFAELARFPFNLLDLAEESTWETCLDQFPEAYREGFVAMARHWANLNSNTQFTPSTVAGSLSERIAPRSGHGRRARAHRRVPGTATQQERTPLPTEARPTRQAARPMSC
jgi:hypothetical protein